jgi:hypothetical protein
VLLAAGLAEEVELALRTRLADLPRGLAAVDEDDQALGVEAAKPSETAAKSSRGIVAAVSSTRRQTEARSAVAEDAEVGL